MQLLQCIATPLAGGGSGTPAMRGPTSWGDRESCPGGGRCLKRGTPAMHCHTTRGQWTAELLQDTASPPGGSGQRNSCNALTHRLEAVGSATPAMQCQTIWGWRAVELLQCVGPPAGGQGVLPRRWSLPKERNSCNALPHYLGAVGSATLATDYLTAWGQWALQLVQCTSTLSGGSGHGTNVMQWFTSSGQWVLQFLQCTATLPGGSGQRKSCNTLPNGPGVVGNGTPAIHCLAAWG